MRALKNVAIFMAGGLTFGILLSKGLVENVRHPREGTVEYEDDRIKVVRAGTKPPKEGVVATASILYKKHSE